MATDRTTKRGTSSPPLASSSDAGLSKADRSQPLMLLGSIGVGLGFAKLAPSTANSLNALVPIGVFVLLYLVMLSIDTRRVAEAFGERRFLAIAIGLNFALNPLVAWMLGRLFLGDHPDLRVGLLLFLLTPCIGWYLIFTELAGGDVGLGVSLLAVNLVLQVVLLPVYLLLFEGETSTIDLRGITQSVLIYLVLPAAAAALTRRVVAVRLSGMDSVHGVIARAHLKTVALVVVIVAMFASEADTLFDNPSVVARLMAPLLVFFVVAFVLALVAGHFGRLPYDQTALLAFTATSRNSEASLAIAATAFASPLVALAVVVGPVIELPLLILMVRVLRSRLKPPIDQSLGSVLKGAQQ